MRRPQPVGDAFLPGRLLLIVDAHPTVRSFRHLSDLVVPQELPAGAVVVPEQHALPGDEHQPAVVVLHLGCSATGVLDLVQQINGGAVVDRFDGAVLEPPCREEPDTGDLAGEELACEVDLADRVVVPERTQLPRLLEPVLV